MDSFNHSEFISKLKELGFEIKTKTYNSSNYSTVLEVNDLSIDNKNYPLFGYKCNGTYAPCHRSDQTEFTQLDIDNAIKESVKILSKEIDTWKFLPNYHSCKDYLTKNFTKTKKDIEATKRVFEFIKNNFNDIIRAERNKEKE